MAIIIYLLVLFALCIIGLKQINIADAKLKQSNDTWIRHRNTSMMCLILCIIMLFGLIANRDEFLSINQSKNCSMKENQCKLTPSFPFMEKPFGTRTEQYRLLDHLN